MAIKEIKEKILSDAQKDANEIIFQAESRAKEMISKGKKEADALKNSILAKHRQEGLLKKNKIITEANLDARKTLLSERQTIIEGVFKKALENILNMDNQKYCKYIKKIILSNIENGDETITIGKSDKERITDTFIENINKELKSKGKKGELKLNDSYIQIQGGVIIGSGDIKKNISLELLLLKAREKYEMAVNSQLFK
jgi:V/A-type H+/Na+-transporting ATPase subunit E